MTICRQTDTHAYAFSHALLSPDLWGPAYQEGSSHTRAGLFNYRGEDIRRKADKQNAATHALFPCPLGLGATTWVEGSGTGTRQEPLREGEKRVGLCQGAGLAGEGGASVEGWGQG